jgi:dihydrofolate reductase
MRKIKHLIHMSLDGYANAPDGNFEWMVYNDEIEKYAHDLIHNTGDAVLWGRNTFEGMKTYWPTVLGNSGSSPAELEHANWLNHSTKYVVSTTLTEAELGWENTVVLGENFAEEIAKIKQQPGKDILIMGSLALVRSLREHGLIDEFYINVNPKTLGGGTPLFAPSEQEQLNLVEARTLQGGVVALQYTRV